MYTFLNSSIILLTILVSVIIKVEACKAAPDSALGSK